MKAGKLKALAVTSTARSPLLPDVPTVAENGYPGFSADAWFGVIAPAKTPKNAIARLHPSSFFPYTYRLSPLSFRLSSIRH